MGGLVGAVDEILAQQLRQTEELNSIGSHLRKLTSECSIETAFGRFPPKEDSDDERSVAEGGSVLGRGSFGTVYRMQHSIDNRLFAVKQVRLSIVEGFVKFEIVEREAKILTQLENLYIVRSYTCYYSKNKR